MGTSLRVVVIDPDRRADRATIENAIQETVDQVNSQFSNWHEHSEVSRFNANPSTDPIEISEPFQRLIAAANNIHLSSSGRLDITLGPLIELWGFGAPSSRSEPPSDQQIALAMGLVGQTRVLDFDQEAGTLRKAKAGTGIYLAALAKGAGIDAIAERLREMGFDNLMVEVGGDLVAFGGGRSGDGWRIGIERPDTPARAIEEIVAVSAQGMATSGDYRNYFEEDGVRYSHIIDATTGRPVTHNTASVTVLAENAMLADAWATALLALGSEKGLQLAEEQGLAALFINRRQDSAEIEFEHLATSSFTGLLPRNED